MEPQDFLIQDEPAPGRGTNSVSVRPCAIGGAMHHATFIMRPCGVLNKLGFTNPVVKKFIQLDNAICDQYASQLKNKKLHLSGREVLQGFALHKTFHR